MDIRFGIVIPAYNCSNKIHGILHSIMNQTYKNYKVIIIDDGSSDATYAVCKIYESTYDNISVVRQKNQGPSIARRTGFLKLREDYILFMDADDFIHSNMLKKLRDSITENPVDIVEFGFQKMSLQGNELETREFVDEELNGECLEHYIYQKNTTNFLWNKVFKRSLIKHEDFLPLYYSEDACLLANVFSRCDSYRVIEDRLYYYVVDQASACGQKMGPKWLDMIKADKYMINLVSRKSPELVSHMACTACSHAAKLYGYFRMDDCLTEEIEHEIQGHFKRNYKLMSKNKSEVFENASRKRKLSIGLFRLSPNLYVKILNRIKI